MSKLPTPQLSATVISGVTTNRVRVRPKSQTPGRTGRRGTTYAVTVSLTPDDLERVDAAARERGVNRSEVVRGAVRQAVKP
jgi:hypothetical protein